MAIFGAEGPAVRFFIPMITIFPILNCSGEGWLPKLWLGRKSAPAEVAGRQAAIQAECMMFAGPLVGRIYDRKGSDDLAFQIGIGAALLSAAVYLVMPGYRYSANIGAMPEPPKPAR